MILYSYVLVVPVFNIHRSFTHIGVALSTPTVVKEDLAEAETYFSDGLYLLRRGYLEPAITKLVSARIALAGPAPSCEVYLQLARVHRSLGVAFATRFDLHLHKEQDKDSSEQSQAPKEFERALSSYEGSLEKLVLALEYGLDTVTYQMESAVTLSCMALLNYEEALHDDPEDKPRSKAAAITQMYEAHDVLSDCPNPEYELMHLFRLMHMVEFETRRAFRERMMELTAKGSGLEDYRAGARTAIRRGHRAQRIPLRAFLKNWDT